MPPNETCPQCGTLVEDWHLEWCQDGSSPLLYQGKAVTDCPACRKAVSYQGGHLFCPNRDRLAVAEEARGQGGELGKDQWNES
jgi:uncharacterized Zn finger protein (UPF0148 family)